MKVVLDDSNGRVYSKETLSKDTKEHKLTMKFANDWQSLKNDPTYQELNDTVSRIYEDRITIDEEIKEQAHWLANNFSTRNGYTSMEENLIKMGEFVKNRMLDKYNLKNE
jgi:hypothetical protein